MVTSEKYGDAQMAPLAIGLTLAFLIIVALNLTGGSLNAARSLGPHFLLAVVLYHITGFTF